MRYCVLQRRKQRPGARSLLYPEAYSNPRLTPMLYLLPEHAQEIWQGISSPRCSFLCCRSLRYRISFPAQFNV